MKNEIKEIKGLQDLGKLDLGANRIRIMDKLECVDSSLENYSWERTRLK